jgi:hypothetical protein
MRCEVYQRDFVSVAGFVFQACSFNHSDISPFQNQRLASGQTPDYRTPSANSCLFDITLESSGLRAAHSSLYAEIVSNLETS